jgi:hypothetical protein
MGEYTHILFGRIRLPRCWAYARSYTQQEEHSYLNYLRQANAVGLKLSKMEGIIPAGCSLLVDDEIQTRGYCSDIIRMATKIVNTLL